jgi:hypothetical protein
MIHLRAPVVAVLVAGLGLLVPGPRPSHAQPIAGKKLIIKRAPSGKERLLFVSKDASFAFPQIGGADDPSIAGGLIELFSPSEGTTSLSLPPGVGKPGWTVKDGLLRSYKFVNKSAPDGVSPVRVGVFKKGKGLKIVSKASGLAMSGPQGAVGIRITLGSLRSCALFDPSTVRRDVPNSFVAKGALSAALPDCSDESLTGGATTTTQPGGTTTSSTTTTTGGGTTTTTLTGGCGVDDTFDLIQERIFDARGCSVSTCHGAFGAANLDLRPGASYPELIDVLADNPAAAAAGKRLVAPGDAEASFLSQKLRGALLSTEGAQMPLVGGPLPAVELDLVDAWIDAGAPQVGEVLAAPCLSPEEYEPTDPLSPPPGGYQIVLNGPTLQPGEEEEGCLWIPAPNSTDFNVSKWEFALNPGTHHFAIFEYNRAGAPLTNVWMAGDAGCFSGAQFGNNVTGSPQAPYFVDTYPPGVARVMRAGSYLGLNAHYFNEFDVPIQIKVWVNVHPYIGTPDHIAETIVALDSTFTINIPPFTVQTHPPPGQPRARWTNTSVQSRSVIVLGGHMHLNGLRFTAWASDGTKLYESFDWSHPNSRFFTPPLVLSPGDYLEYECEYDNGVNRPVRLDAQGNPTNLIFGVSAEDAMCILTGSFYDD